MTVPWKAGKENSHRFSANWLARFLFFTHNTNCHHEHHMFPQVPYYNLPKLREHLRAKLVMPLSELCPRRAALSEMTNEVQ